MMEQVAFGLIAAALLGTGLMAVTARNLVHSVLWLALALLSTAALYVWLDATFLAAIQVILYTGGVITLMLFGVMLTDQGQEPGLPNLSHRKLAGAALAAIVFGILAAGIHKAGLGAFPDQTAVGAQAIGRALLTEHLLAFEALSVLLLAAMLGAIVIARRRDP